MEFILLNNTPLADHADFLLDPVYLKELPPNVAAPYPVSGKIVKGIDAPNRVIALFTPPLKQRLGLYSWHDVFEWVSNEQSPTLYSIYDIEKAVRMYLHTSHWMFDYFIVAARNNESFAQNILQWATNHRHFQALSQASLLYQDPPSPLDLKDTSTLISLLRTLQAALLPEGLLGVHLIEMLNYFESSLEDVDSLLPELLKRIKKEDDCPTLPEKPQNFDSLSQWVVQSRLNETIT